MLDGCRLLLVEGGGILSFFLGLLGRFGFRGLLAALRRGIGEILLMPFGFAFAGFGRLKKKKKKMYLCRRLYFVVF